MILAKAEPKDILTARKVRLVLFIGVYALADPVIQTCTTLKRISSSRTVWRSVYLDQILPNIPQSQYLPKPLLQCSVKDLEKVVVNWCGTWPSQCRMRTQDLKAIKCEATSEWATPTGFHLIRGGRWLLTQLVDGSIWYFDLHDLRQFRLLLPPHSCLGFPLPTPAGLNDFSTLR